MQEETITRRRAETQARLLDAAIGVFADRGVLAASVEEICERADFTRGAFYSNFSSKNDLVLAFMDRDRQETKAGLMQLAARFSNVDLGGSREQVLQAATEFFASTQTSTRENILINAEIRLYAAREPSIRAAYQEFHDAFNLEMASALERIVDEVGLILSMPVSQAVATLIPVYEACRLLALMRLPETGADDVMTLGPELSEALQPFYTLLSMWIIGVNRPLDSN